jgi:hypothetical protein
MAGLPKFRMGKWKTRHYRGSLDDLARLKRDYGSLAFAREKLVKAGMDDDISYHDLWVYFNEGHNRYVHEEVCRMMGRDPGPELEADGAYR